MGHLAGGDGNGGLVEINVPLDEVSLNRHPLVHGLLAITVSLP